MEIVIEENINERIDVYLSKKLERSRSVISKMINTENILVNGLKVKNSYNLKLGDKIFVGEYEEEDMNIEKENIELDIVYEDDDVIVINKKNGMVVHPAPGNTKGTLVNALLYYSKNLSDINGEFRPGIVHRIDAYTTGLLMVAKNNKSHEILADELAKKQTTRKYIALVWGVINEDTATIDAPIGRDVNDRKKMAVTPINSKDAITHLKVLERLNNATLVELVLETGRTHQIRVHMDYIGHPVVNDPVYGKRKLIDNTGQCLHAYELGFIHPTSNKYMEFSCEIPECFKNILEKFK
ncbi:MAG: RluA family pseudouridine synthase [bacterium]|nr:RluA family pseudouridine synthase [bacterium]